LGLGGVAHLLLSEPVEFHEHGGER
ncbi:MAG: hypothetical protein QOE10_1279, partial [Gaiellales bacterium]|nr:hypothetical protein [Gaiellales bacterium]